MSMLSDTNAIFMGDEPIGVTPKHPPVENNPLLERRRGRFHVESADGIGFNTRLTVEGVDEEDLLIPATKIVLHADAHDVWRAEIHVILPKINMHNLEGEVFIHSLNLPDDHWLSKLREHTEKAKE